MMIKLVILLATVLMFAFAEWALLSASRRVRYLCSRLHLRLLAGKGLAHLFSLWLRWSCLAAIRHPSWIRPSLPIYWSFVSPCQHAMPTISRFGDASSPSASDPEPSPRENTASADAPWLALCPTGRRR